MNNLVKRTVFGALFLLIMVGGIIANRYTFAVLALVILVGMMNEYYRMTMKDRYKFSRFLAILAGVILFLLVFLSRGFGVPGKFMILAMLPIFVVMINSLYVKDKTEYGMFADVLTGLVYIAIPFTFMNVLVFNAEGQYNGVMLLCFYAIIWASDVGAYCAGITLGRKWGGKLFPEVSPNKSWMGFWGGLVTAVLISMIFYWTGIFTFAWYHCIILAIVMNVFGVYGDLFESQWKRYCCIKDSGKAIPGHGGFLDRFDSSLLAIPVGVIYLILFNLI